MADDSAAVRRMVQQMFEKASYQVICASSGEEAFAQALAQPFDAIITDVTMEDLSGVQLCRILNGDPATSGIPVVMLTATDTPYSRFCARHAGAEGYITKADARETLVPTIEALVDRSRPRAGRSVAPGAAGVDPVRRLSQVLEEHLFLTLVSSEIRGFVRHTDSRHALASAVLRLCAEVLDHHYAVLELLGPQGRSLTLRAHGPWPDDDSVGLEALGIDGKGAQVERLSDDRDVSGAVVAGPAQRCVIEAADEHLGSLTVFGGAGGLGSRSTSLARHIAVELSAVVRSLMLLERMREMAETDTLTGLANRRRTVERLTHELARAQRTERPLCLVICDVDHFKAVNDTHGHNVGDDVLRAVASELESRIRTVDLVGRWGGEEFVLVLPEAPLEGGRLVAERLRRAIASLELEGPARSVTISAGVVECDPKLPLDTLVQRADECLYDAKNAGRNRVVACTADGTRG